MVSATAVGDHVRPHTRRASWPGADRRCEKLPGTRSGACPWASVAARTPSPRQTLGPLYQLIGDGLLPPAHKDQRPRLPPGISLPSRRTSGTEAIATTNGCVAL